MVVGESSVIQGLSVTQWERALEGVAAEKERTFWVSTRGQQLAALSSGQGFPPAHVGPTLLELS